MYLTCPLGGAQLLWEYQKFVKEPKRVSIDPSYPQTY